MEIGVFFVEALPKTFHLFDSDVEISAICS